MSKTFFYFAFGSNLLSKGLHKKNLTGKRVTAGKLLNYRLDFNVPSDTWRGAEATIVPTKDGIVYGTIWEFDIDSLKNLDNQEGVFKGLYVPVHVQIKPLHNDSLIECRAYRSTEQPDSDLRRLSPNTTPIDRQPSMSYLKTVVKGAIETGLPTDYINWLRSIKHNGKVVNKFEEHFNLNDVVLRN